MLFRVYYEEKEAKGYVWMRIPGNTVDPQVR